MLSVYRVRPRDPNEDAHSDEDFDEELVLDETTLERAMQTRVGGKEQHDTEELKNAIRGKVCHEEIQGQQ